MIRRFLSVLAVAAVAFMAPSQAADAPVEAPGSPAVSDADRAAIREVIQGQLDAMRRDDAAAAFAFASPNIQAEFGHDPATFMDMVKRGYAPVYHPRSTAFGVLSVEGGRVVQRLEVVGPDQAGREALYYMEREPDGHWRISGCVLTDDPGVGA